MTHSQRAQHLTASLDAHGGHFIDLSSRREQPCLRQVHRPRIERRYVPIEAPYASPRYSIGIETVRTSKPREVHVSVSWSSTVRLAPAGSRRSAKSLSTLSSSTGSTVTARRIW